MSYSASDLLNFLISIGCRKRGQRYILDGCNSEFYLIFNTEYDEETPGSLGTCDIIIAPIGSYPLESEGKMRIAANCDVVRVSKFLMALDSDLFADGLRNIIGQFCLE